MSMYQEKKDSFKHDDLNLFFVKNNENYKLQHYFNEKEMPNKEYLNEKIISNDK